MGLFPPLRAMLYVTVFLTILLGAYIALLLKIRADEVSEVRLRRAPIAATGRSTYKAGNGYGRPYGSDDVYANGNGAGIGAELYDQQFLREGGVRIIDEDVHVVVRRSDEFDVQALRASGRSSG